MHDDQSNEPLESLLREHFAAHLDPQLGRANAAFQQHASEGFVEPKRQWSARRLSLLAGMATALAATIVVTVVLRRQPQPVAMPAPRDDAPRPAMKRQPTAPQPSVVAKAPTDSVPIDSVPTDSVPIDAVPIDAVPTNSVANSASSAADTPSEPTAAIAAASAEQPAKEASPQLVKRGIEWRTLESEVIQLDSNTPVRKLRRQRLEHREYFDPQHGARMKLILPREEVRYESIPTQ